MAETRWGWAGWGSGFLTAAQSLPQGMQACPLPVASTVPLPTPHPPCLAEWHGRPEVHSPGKVSAEARQPAPQRGAGGVTLQTLRRSGLGFTLSLYVFLCNPLAHVLSWCLLHLGLPFHPQTGGDLAARRKGNVSQEGESCCCFFSPTVEAEGSGAPVAHSTLI